VAAVALCLLGLLILPQVDPDDFVLNSAGSIRICLDHVSVDAFACGEAVSIFFSHGLLLYGFNVLQLTSILERTNVSLELKKTSALRC
jgi:hypothetical protein